VEPNAHHLLNVGDVAMLQIAVERLSAVWPEASINVITENPARLAVCCPSARPVDAEGRRLWFEDYYFTYTLHRVIPDAVSARTLELERILRRRWPTVAEHVIRARARLRRDDLEPLEEFLAAVDSADIVVSTGAGALTDAFAPLALSILELLETAKRNGALTALLGHGIGPIEDDTLLRRAGAVLPSVDLITLREGKAGPAILEALGVAPDRVLVTGDDAVELAYRDGRGSTLGRGLGVSLRVARYSQVAPAILDVVGAAIREAVARHGTDPVPIPISWYPREADATVIGAIVGGAPAPSEPPRPIAIVDRVRECRVIVTGSYHAAVFALSQGVPAVTLTGSRYYDAKFEGLSDLFEGGVWVVRLDGGGLHSALNSAIDEAWQAADELRPGLLDVAASQVEQGRAAYRELRKLASRGI
jgi:polysaccharide pyruvyl transferase WcaK-like protein